MDYHTICKIIKESEKSYSSGVGKPKRIKQLVAVPSKMFIAEQTIKTPSIFIKNTGDTTIGIKHIVGIGKLWIYSGTGKNKLASKIVNGPINIEGNDCLEILLYIGDDPIKLQETHGILIDTYGSINSVFIPIVYTKQ